jgi:hypothetical protein
MQDECNGERAGCGGDGDEQKQRFRRISTNVLHGDPKDKYQASHGSAAKPGEVGQVSTPASDKPRLVDECSVAH